MMTRVIDSYQFGEIVIHGEKYQSDVVILPSHIKAHWQRKNGHRLSPDDLAEVILEKPDMLIVGTGAFGKMSVLPETWRYLEAQGIELITETTEEACQLYNQLHHFKKVVAVLHLTC